MKNTSEKELQDILRLQQDAYKNSGPPDLHRRLDRIDRMIALLVDNADKIADALNTDFGSRPQEVSLAADVLTPVTSLKYCRSHIREWMKRDKRKVAFPFGLMGAKAYVEYQPLGTVGIIAPWNFPFALAMSPIASVFAAGNRAMIKPSEATPHSSALMQELVAAAYDTEEVAVCTGDTDVGIAFSKLPFDHLIFTGSGAVATHIMRSAAENLTPVTLELGGKSPVIVSDNADIEMAARRIANAKLLNAGQICLSPDYVFVPRHLETEFINSVKNAMFEYFPSIVDNPDYTSIINKRQYVRLDNLVNDAQRKGAEVIEINPANEAFSWETTLKLAPRLLRKVDDSMAVMQEEIFGPLLPIITYTKIEEVVESINSRPRALALYYFGKPNSPEFDLISSRIICGGLTINDIGAHAQQEDLPFGGVGPSGMGRYHGKEGFLAFSHHKSVYLQTSFGVLSVMQPPYGARFRRILSWMIRK